MLQPPLHYLITGRKLCNPPQEDTNDEAEVDKVVGVDGEEGGEGEQEMQAKQAILLFLPGKIIHIITSDTTNSRYVGAGFVYA